MLIRNHPPPGRVFLCLFPGALREIKPGRLIPTISNPAVAEGMLQNVPMVLDFAYKYVGNKNAFGFAKGLVKFANKVISESNKAITNAGNGTREVSLPEETVQPPVDTNSGVGYNGNSESDFLDQAAGMERDSEVSWKVNNSYTATEVNTWWKEQMGYDNPPYRPETTVKEIILSQDKKFVRVYDGISSKQIGGWLMRPEDIEGLSPEQIQDKFALPNTPKYITDVIIPKGTTIRVGTVNPIEGWGQGGGTQFDLMGQRIGIFTNERLLK